MSNFPCTKCGACCRNVSLSALTAYLDRGDGVCRHHTDQHICSIYAQRPDVCRVDVYYAKHHQSTSTWDDFVKLNLIACEQLLDLEKIKKMGS